MDSDEKTDDSGRNLMHQTNDKICIGENAQVTQHDPESKNANDKEHFEAPHRPILDVNVVKKSARVHQSKILLEGHTRYRPCS